MQIQQVIINLIRNAQEAVHDLHGHDLRVVTELSPAPKIRLRAVAANGEEIMVTVADHGPGVPPEMSDSLFEPFVTGKPDGLGVGLAVCRSIIAAHGGRIWVENGADGGAEFHFTLPVAPGTP